MPARSERIPVIVGVGQCNDRPLDPTAGLDSLGLMEQALRAAEVDARGGWLSRLDSLAVVDQLSFPELEDVSKPLAERVGAAPRHCSKTRYASGDSPILLLNEAANRIGSGEAEVAAVVGGEALRTAAARAAAASGSAAGSHSVFQRRHPLGYRQRYGLAVAVDVYPLYENAGRAAYGQSLDEAQRESGEIWSRMSQVAAENPGAWIRKAMTSEEILTPTAANRRISFPYTKLMVANGSVNQGAGFIVTSLARARAAGIPEDHLVYIGRGAAAHEPDDFLARDRYDASPSMAVSLSRALDRNGLGPGDLDWLELYSCFPCVPKMARRVLGWPVTKPVTVFGGLTFGGGPVGNYMSHAVVSMVERLRSSGRHGLLFANGGFATQNHTIVLSRDEEIGSHFPQGFDFQAEADAKRGSTPPLDREYEGPATIETYTVHYDRAGEVRFGTIVGRAPGGARFLARVPATDEDAIAFLTDGLAEPVGTCGRAVAGSDGERVWVL
jgi:acetyl-CoA C-acetyltransferase